MQEDIKKAFKIGFRLGCEVTEYFHTPKRKRDVIKHGEYCLLLYNERDQLIEKYDNKQA